MCFPDGHVHMCVTGKESLREKRRVINHNNKHHHYLSSQADCAVNRAYLTKP